MFLAKGIENSGLRLKRRNPKEASQEKEVSIMKVMLLLAGLFFLGGYIIQSTFKHVER